MPRDQKELFVGNGVMPKKYRSSNTPAPLKTQALRTYITQGSFLLDFLKSLIPTCNPATQVVLSSYLKEVGTEQDILSLSILSDGERSVMPPRWVYFGNVIQAARMLALPPDDVSIKWCNVIICRRDEIIQEGRHRIIRKQLRELRFPGSIMHRDDTEMRWP